MCWAGAPVSYGRRRFGCRGRAYSRGLGESVTRGDRRQRERWFGRPSPPLASPREYTARFLHSVSKEGVSGQKGPVGPMKNHQMMPVQAWVDWRRRLSLSFILMQLKYALQVIRPCRESATGWTPEAVTLPGNHSSLELNERGPALKVFWSRPWRDGRRVGERTRLPKPTRVVIERLTKKAEPEGAGQETSRPLLSVRIVVQPRHQLITR